MTVHFVCEAPSVDSTECVNAYSTRRNAHLDISDPICSAPVARGAAATRSARPWYDSILDFDFVSRAWKQKGEERTEFSSD